MGRSIACWCQIKTLVCASLLLITCSWEYYGGSLRLRPASLLSCSWRGVSTRLSQPVLKGGRCSIHSVWVTGNVSAFLVSFGTIHVHSLSILLVPNGWSRYRAGVAECSSHQERVDSVSLLHLLCLIPSSGQAQVSLLCPCSHATRHRGMTIGSGGTITVTGALEEQVDDRELPF